MDASNEPPAAALDVERVPFCWGVRYQLRGMELKYVTLDYAKALDFAAQWHGIVVRLYE